MAQGDEIDLALFESGHTLMLAEAELILVPNACTLEQNRINQFKARAFENMVGLAMANYPSPKCNSHSMAVKPNAFDEQERSLDVTLVEADEREGMLRASTWPPSVSTDVARHGATPITSRGCTEGSMRSRRPTHHFFAPTFAADRFT